LSPPPKGRPAGFRHHERPADPAQESDRPLEPKARPGDPDVEHPPDEDPHHRLNNPVGDPDRTADSDPFEPDPEAADPPPPGRYPGPGPEPDPHGEPEEGVRPEGDPWEEPQ
jgi:hypothetical protein